MDLKAKARQLKIDISVQKIFAGAAAAYALTPINLTPDVIPMLGYLDDIILLSVLIALSVRFIPQNIFERYQKEADENPKK